MDRPSTINIVGRSTGVGLDRDAALLTEILAETANRVTFSHYRSRSWLASLFPSRQRFQATVFLERVFPRWFGTSSVNLLIPNQERFPHRHVRRLKQVDHVLCKTRHAEEIFRGLGCAASHVGFTSRDRYREDVTMSYEAVLHLAGRSTFKGTEAVLRLWSRHPEWPELRVVRHRRGDEEDLPANVTMIHDYLAEDELSRLQNQCGIHLLPSLAEGWGHALVEGLSCGAVVVTTGAPPMNELVDDDRGVLVPYARSAPRHLGTSFYVDEEALERSVQNVLDLPSEAKRSVGKRAREWFIANDAGFRARLPEVIGRILS